MKNYKELLKENRAWIEETFKKVDKKLSRVAVRSRDKLVDGVGEDGVTHKSINPLAWTSGFFGGMNVLMYEYTKNEDYLLTAKRSEELLDVALANYEALYHDVGFMWHILSGALYRITGDESSKRRNLFAASALMSRYVLSGNFIRAWNDNSSKGWAQRPVKDWSIIDCMMNLPLLYWASDYIGDDRFKQVAMAHADMTLEQHIRPDGSVNHIIEHDRETGECVECIGGQGIAPDSSWSRGQSWAVYGFALSYIHTGEKRYLDAAKRVANYFIANVCDDWIPRIDFRAPSTPVYYDTTSAMCAACGMLELAKALPENEGGMYANAAINMMKAVSERFGDFDPETDVMISHGSVRYPVPGVYDEKQAGVHIPIIYAEYYFVEALLKLLGSDFLAW
ncbi:MAG: glycoside hydrolase family 88 protein [Clostridia bacterium]|nr:glycoside hydrolase family 88 protein [Clostridia bacterium]